MVTDSLLRPLPDPPPEPPAALIAGDLAMAIHQRLIRPGEQLPTQGKLMLSYTVSAGTVSSALRKLAAADLIRVVPGRGAYAVDHGRARVLRHNPVLDILDAADICRSEALAARPPSDREPIHLRMVDSEWDRPHVDPEKVWPPRKIPIGALAALDRHLLRWLGEAFLLAARRVVHTGLTAADEHLLAAARSILDNGARRPEEQFPIVGMSGATSAAEDVATRIWPERRMPLGHDEPPF